MSVNPYKWIPGIYAEETMLNYHGKAGMVEAGELAPHLFGVADHAYSQLVSRFAVGVKALQNNAAINCFRELQVYTQRPWRKFLQIVEGKVAVGRCGDAGERVHEVARNVVPGNWTRC